MNNNYLIFVESHDGNLFKMFTWTKDLESGIQYGKLHAKENGINFPKIWSTKVSTERMENA